MSYAVRLVHDWSLALQERARRNARNALAECDRRRAEREDVERFLAARV